MKKLAIICALAMVMTMIAPFAAVSAAETETPGELFWDFENNEYDKATDDIALHAGNNTPANIINMYNSGGWGKEWPANNSDASWKFNITQVPHTGDANSPAEALADGDGYCAAVWPNNTDATWPSIGMGIMLDDARLIPNKEYTIEFDIFNGQANITWTNDVYVAFSKPSAYTPAEGTNKYNDSAYNKTRIPWLREGAGRYFKASVVNPNYPELNGATCTWGTVTATFTTPGDLYENGSVMLYIAIADPYDCNVGGKNARVYFDNIRLTPTDDLSEGIAYTKFTYGKVWDFENDYGVDEEGNYVRDLGIPGHSPGGNTVYLDTFANGEWSMYTDVNGDEEGLSNDGETKSDGTFRGPKIRSVEDAKLYNNTPSSGNEGPDDGNNGLPAPGSKYCARVRCHDNFGGSYNKATLGMRVRLTEEEFPAGDYTLSFYGAWTKPSSDGFKLCAKIYPGEKLIVDADAAVGVSPADYTVVNNSFAGATQEFVLGSVGKQWAKYTQDIELTNDDFDENGVATLILHTSINQLPPSAMLYFDDISLVANYTDIPDIGVKGFVTTVSYADFDDAMIAAGMYFDAAPLDYIIDADTVQGDISGVTHNSIELEVTEDAINDGWPTAKIYIFDKFLAPILNEPIEFDY